MSADLQGLVMNALDRINDPCSVATRRPLSIVELGLLVNLEVDPERGHVQITLRATSPSCMLIASIMQAVDTRVSALDGVSDVEVRLDPTSDWSPSTMTPAGASKLHDARSQAMLQLPTPRTATARQADAHGARGGTFPPVLRTVQIGRTPA